MTTLQKKMADFGFESNDNYDYHLRCLLNSLFNGIKTMNIDGDKGRRKTAFANALAHALNYPHLFYYDFTQTQNTENKVVLPPSEDDYGITEIPVSDFDHIMSESCAFSEGEPTVLILDQLQAADFKDHIRIYHFIKSSQWSLTGNTLQASKTNLLLLLISEEDLYHSLQKCSFRIWINTISSAHKNYTPADFSLHDDILPIMHALSQVFTALEVAPTFSEYQNILNDIHLTIQTEQQLMHSLFGWIEGTDREQLYSPSIYPLLSQVIHQLQRYQGFDTDIIES
jgi:hypothetical protein